MTVVRFAPSPTGKLHIGNVRTALLNWLYARKVGGTFVLRFDDTDQERSRQEFVEAIRHDLTWLGLAWDREERQSARTDRYNEIIARLKAEGRLYPCYETSDELERKRRRQRARGLPPIYDRAALKLNENERAKLEGEGKKPHWRFRLNNTPDLETLAPQPTPVTWQDMIHGSQTVDVGSLSDPVFIRADGTYLYTLTSVIDDMDFGMTHIIRGGDHVTNTGVQIELFDALGASAPVFGHHGLLVSADGQALSKRLGALSIESFREDGLESMAVASHAALIGTSYAIEPYKDLDKLAELFDATKISVTPSRFDPDELKGLNTRLLNQLSFSEVEDRLSGLRIDGGEEFWLAVRGNLETFDDVKTWWSIVSHEPSSEVTEKPDAEFLQKAAAHLPPEPWSDETWAEWTKAVKDETGLKGRALFHPLRVALTGCNKGPELKLLLPLIGRERTLGRLMSAD